MIRFLNGLIMAFTMYTTIPMPKNKWEEKNFPFILVNLPIVGIFIGILWYFIALVLIKVNLSQQISTVILMLFPLILTGFIHIDGYMDTCDAIFSRASLEKKREILKDSRVGAFAVIGAISLAFFYYASIQEIIVKNQEYLKALIFIPVFSRCMAVLFTIKTKLISEKGFIADFKKGMNKKHFLSIVSILILSILLAYFIAGEFMIFIALMNILFASFSALYSINQMNGISGDLCGFIITLSSALSLGVLAII